MIKNVTTRIASITRASSYVFLLVQWMWVFLLYCSWAIDSGVLQAYLDASHTTSPQQSIGFELPEFIRQPLGVVVLSAMLILSVIMFVRTPKKATQMTIHATKVTAKSITPAVQKLAHVRKTQKKQLAGVVLAGVIIVLSGLAYLLTLPVMYNLSLSASLVGIVSVALGIMTIGTLALSLFLGYLSRKNTRSNLREV